MAEKWFDSTLPADRRIDSLIGAMTVEEKASQLLYNSKAVPRLGIPEYNWWNEALHGVARAGKATIFPQALGMAAAFDCEMMEEIAGAIADEARAKYGKAVSEGNRGQYMGLTFWSPNINIFRDPRWGRGQETYGEDPCLTSELGQAFVKGLQGNHPTRLKTAACAKHFAVHSGPEALRHEFDAVADEKDMRETYLPAFRDLVTKANVEAVMGAYNRTNGEPCCASETLLVKTLRGEWEFKGHVVSDCWAIQNIHETHKVTKTPEESTAQALASGCDINCGCTYDYILSALKQGLITEELIDTSLRRSLRTRIRLGLLDPPEEDPWKDISEEVIDCEKHRKLARKAAARSVVLLKNKDNALPIREDVKKVQVLGPNGANMEAMLGNYYGSNPRIVTVLEGIAGRVSSGVTVEYRPGVMIDHPNANPLHWAVFEADNFEYTVAVMGLDQRLEGEEGDSIASEMMGDRLDLKLPGEQLDFLKKLSAKKSKLIVVVISGSPLILDEVHELADAVLWTCYPGEEGGSGISDILFGDENPSGRLPVTFPRSVDDIPPFEEYSMRGRTYRYMEKAPFYPFGFGLSYMDFSYGEPVCSCKNLHSGQDLTVIVPISNGGANKGGEVVQLYLTGLEMPFRTPFLTLKEFRRVELEGGETKQVEFVLKPEDFLLINDEGEEVRQPGQYRITLGGAAPVPRTVELGGARPASTEITLI
jgi:beta-glucosidase